MSVFSEALPPHGGPDAAGVPLHDFSTNSNACGPCPEALRAVQQADATCYPDPAYTALRESLGALHGVAPERIVLAGSASEFIHRITALAAQQGARAVALPAHCYGDYPQAAQARGLALLRPTDAGSASVGLQWACEPGSPQGLADPALGLWVQAAADADPAAPPVLRVLDCAYAPLRLDGVAWSGPSATSAPCWQLWTPNKALGLTGVRAAYAVAPPGSEVQAQVQALAALAPSWPVGAHGVAMLQAWVQPGAQRWRAASLVTLAAWKQRQLALCERLGWAVQGGSLANYFCALPPGGMHERDGAHLRAAGIKLRECTSFGLPGWVRLGVRSPAAQQALEMAWRARAPSAEKKDV
ncbi:aminotransferase class I/II-fold pyridoxal phosphate-dependent enzyme [Acidovorax soli]|uniref:Histidinol-phosphate aminotransferase n=1 Tax=Acidovorax soli TaxID=592050 RepID=A0A1H3ZEL3_9BURK|nr:aminotransferase class I/II-fold pyridoxal phosphate-dependent enzyme [Acidovorax soli]SEA22209.1 histidinol-phosphate aminotransferase [Acidovorax soli]